MRNTETVEWHEVHNDTHIVFDTVNQAIKASSVLYLIFQLLEIRAAGSER